MYLLFDWFDFHQQCIKLDHEHYSEQCQDLFVSIDSFMCKCTSICTLDLYWNMLVLRLKKCCEFLFSIVWQPCLCKTVTVIVEFQLNFIYRAIIFYTETSYIHSCWYKVQFLLNSYIFSCNGFPETGIFCYFEASIS